MDRTAPFVRTAMIPQAPPPRGETGLVHWVRANLFATPLDAVLTVLSVVVVWQIAVGIGPWFLNAVWNASSLAQCREILAGEPG
ncbi:MAG: amino acid ABC transporter permease, partial [Gemmobacter sp.]